MEIIRLPGYLETEKVEIARRFLVPKQIAAAGLKPSDLKVSVPTLAAMVNRYTREAGVRNLEREIAGLCRKVAKRKAAGRLRGGVRMATALVSALTGVPTRPDLAMTGEITLRGTVLPIGGVNEKAVAARRAGIKTVLVPRANEKDFVEIPEDVRAELEFVLVDNMDQVLDRALQRPSTGAQPESGSEPASYAH